MHDPLIVGFGVYGNELDKVTHQTYNYGFEVHCTTSNNPSLDCPLEEDVTTTMATTTVPMTTTPKMIKEATAKPEDKQGSSVKTVVGGSVSAGELGGFLIGAIIVVLLLVLITPRARMRSRGKAIVVSVTVSA